jgi:hypothetical protein
LLGKQYGFIESVEAKSALAAKKKIVEKIGRRNGGVSLRDVRDGNSSEAPIDY